ncbi:MAG: UDP-N-acetylmuramate dehydrogenase [Clostridiaceae bacterium]
MNLYKDFSKVLASVLGSDKIYIDEPMKMHTSFKVGGPADILATPDSAEGLVRLLQLCEENKVPYIIIGNGSNLLVRDGGIRGVVVKLSKMDRLQVQGEKIIAESGVKLCDVCNVAMMEALTGLEFACGIPGSIGGAVAMNAGAYNGEISNVIESARAIDKLGNIRTFSRDELMLGYRTSIILKEGYTVVDVTLKLEKGDREKIKNRIEDLNRRRSEKQPLEFPSAGSTFKRPEGHFAAKLIEDTGLKGLSVGGAEVSKKHSGFIINKQEATARDILELIELVRKQVMEAYGIELLTEVRIVGED